MGRKKKVYTKPKKVKHVHKKRSKAALEYFQVDASGKVIELKQKTTQGQGWFMADHQDRHVCGATGHTMWKTGPDGKRLPIPVQKVIIKEVVAVAKKVVKKKKKRSACFLLQYFRCLGKRSHDFHPGFGLAVSSFVWAFCCLVNNIILCDDSPNKVCP